LFSAVAAGDAGVATTPPSTNFFGQDWSKIWEKVNRFGQILFDLGKIKTLQPQKHSISNGYDFGAHTLYTINL